jgi:hypothetical protein
MNINDHLVADGHHGNATIYKKNINKPLSVIEHETKVNTICSYLNWTLPLNLQLGYSTRPVLHQTQLPYLALFQQAQRRLALLVHHQTHQPHQSL